MSALDTLSASSLGHDSAPSIHTETVGVLEPSAVVGSGCVALNGEVWQGHFAEGLVWALACAAGLNPGKRVLDVDGVDVQISFPGKAETRRYPQIEAQVKSCSNPTYVNDCFSYSIPIKNFNDLIGTVGTDFPVRRYLFLVHAPAAKTDYVDSSSASTHFRHAVYWVDLMDEQPIDPAQQATKSIHIPKANLLTVGSLQDLVKGTIGEGGN
ncbi:DUF4365 domain-containing protein [Actinocrinis puniceicyclus]|uniref:DUF4365 domain-containing protein n=1 Tax=Actinocrinis puniceicyclus TaxID=977794 RepID=A0A8J8BA91_9ACTN|nr:DUF4365 domain-containing protein [Actinocrinis puniceicyclus]MBS2961838.1 DUF4365 domain-containing protein [Actinocrinis puniceicyclus]